MSRSLLGKLRIIKNIETTDEMAYNPGFSVEVSQLHEWKQLPKQGLFFATFKPDIKQTIFRIFENHAGISRKHFINIAHPSAQIASTVVLKTGIYLEPGIVISPFTNIGFGVSINRCVSIGHHTSIEDFAYINPGVHLAGHCKIGVGSTLGIGTIVFDHVQIGHNTIIGGGSVVNKDIPSGVLAYGNPCKVIKTL